MALGDWRRSFIDLSNALDDDDGGLSSSQPRVDAPARLRVPLPKSARSPTIYSPATQSAMTHVPPPGGASQYTPPPAPISTADLRAPSNRGSTQTNTNRPLTSSRLASMGRNGAVLQHDFSLSSATHNGVYGGVDQERALKKIRMSGPEQGRPVYLQQVGQQVSSGSATKTTMNGVPVRPLGNVVQTGPGSGPTHLAHRSPPLRSVHKAPSVQDLRKGLKSQGSHIPFVDNDAASGPRAFQITRYPSVDPASSFSGSSKIQHAVSVSPRPVSQLHTQSSTRQNRLEDSEAKTFATRMPNQMDASIPVLEKSTMVPNVSTSRPNYLSRLTATPQDQDSDNVVPGISSHPAPSHRSATNLTSISMQPSLLPVFLPGGVPAKRSRGRKKLTNQFNEQQDHYLIFLKEVKLHSWKDITTLFNAEFPHREYHTLQSRYATFLNKRDRSRDPTVLSLPARFVAEASIDWRSVRASNSGPQTRNTLKILPQDPTVLKQQAWQPKHQNSKMSLPLPILQSPEHEYSSEADSGPRRERSRRAKRVNYTWPKNHQPDEGAYVKGVGKDEIGIEDWADIGDSVQSETPPEEARSVSSVAVAVDNEPMDVTFETDDAKLALKARKAVRVSQSQQLPYLTVLEQSTVREPLADWEWDQLTSREWQGYPLHVDFSPIEIAVVEKALAKVKGLSQRSRHSTRRRQLRDLLKDLSEPKLLQLTEEIRRHLTCRDRKSITAFLQDAKAGRASDKPQIKRLAAARPDKKLSSAQKSSTTSMIRQREIGNQSRRGWSAASKPVNYQLKNSVMDTLGPIHTWTGAASDIHAVAWAPNGDCFAAGAVAVDDSDSMQYNRPNNLLYGDTLRGKLHELAEHTRKRPKAEKGANSTHAMYISQDPKLYTTVSAVGFSNSGKLMYSAGYDETICAWHIESASAQPVLGAKLNTRTQIDIMTVSRKFDGLLATAAKTTDNKAIRVLTVNEEDPSEFGKHSFHSDKAVTRSDLKILPSALQFEPAYGNLLLAGFGANRRDVGFDTTGDICLWDVETQTQFHLNGASRNVFDVEFNPNRSYMPLFAVGCVAGASVNRGTRSVLRFYEEKVDKYRCPLEIECRALDINELIWCPYDEYILAAGCTDGRTYVWDLRWPTDPVWTLSHGQSLMPLQDGVPHEVTDTGVRFLSWGENATRLYSGSSDGVVKVWDVTRGEENTFIKNVITLDSGIMSGAFSPDMTKLVLGEVNGSVTVLEVGRDDCSIKDVERFSYVPYNDGYEDLRNANSLKETTADSGIATGNHYLQTKQLQFEPMGSLPMYQVVQGPSYAGPYDQSVDAPYLREQALAFQFSMAKPIGPQCDMAACKSNTNKTTSEEIGDSGRSADRIPDELRRAWEAPISNTIIISGKSKCTYCSRPARPSQDFIVPTLCERCSFACFRCGAVNPIAPATTTLICDLCAGVWDIGALGYECIDQPMTDYNARDIPLLTAFGDEVVREKRENLNASFGDEVSALTDYYFSLAIDRPESPPL